MLTELLRTLLSRLNKKELSLHFRCNYEMLSHSVRKILSPVQTFNHQGDRKTISKSEKNRLARVNGVSFREGEMWKIN